MLSSSIKEQVGASVISACGLESEPDFSLMQLMQARLCYSVKQLLPWLQPLCYVQ